MAGLILVAASVVVVGQPDPRQMSGVPLPTSDVPIGTISVRVLRGSFANNVTDHPVEFSVDGRRQTVTTDAEGRAQISGLPQGARVRATTVLDGQTLTSQEMTVGSSGYRVVLAGTAAPAAPSPAEGGSAPLAGGSAAPPMALAPAVPGTLEMGPNTRVVAAFENDTLQLFYSLQILNEGDAPVDIGGPVIFELPREARGTSLLEGSVPQATAAGPRVIVPGPFMPGTTAVQVAFDLPYSGSTAELVQPWPVRLPQTMVLLVQTGGLGLESPDLAFTREVIEQGQPIVVGTGPSVEAGETLTVSITGLPSHPLWPRYLALALAGVIMMAGIWAAATARPRGVAA